MLAINGSVIAQNQPTKSSGAARGFTAGAASAGLTKEPASKVAIAEGGPLVLCNNCGKNRTSKNGLCFACWEDSWPQKGKRWLVVAVVVLGVSGAIAYKRVSQHFTTARYLNSCGSELRTAVIDLRQVPNDYSPNYPSVSAYDSYFESWIGDLSDFYMYVRSHSECFNSTTKPANTVRVNGENITIDRPPVSYANIATAARSYAVCLAKSNVNCSNLGGSALGGLPRVNDDIYFGLTRCTDGWISHSAGRGTCSHHGGEAHPSEVRQPYPSFDLDGLFPG